MKPPNLDADYLRSVLDYDPLTGIFRTKVVTSNSCKIGEIRGTLRDTGYLAIRVKNRLCQAHHLAWFYVYGEWPSRPTDHVNRTKTDNRIANLRLATPGENTVNSPVRVNNTSGFKGVSKTPGGKWRARITIDRKEHLIGVFASKSEASAAYRVRLHQAFGEFAETSQIQR
jgi:hypothetical protein